MPLVVTLISGLVLSVALAATGATARVGTAGSPTSTSGAQSTAAAQSGPIARNAQGRMVSRLVGETASGRQVTGTFTPLRFVRRDGRIVVRGLIDGVVHRPGPDVTFAGLRTMRVKTINGTPATTRGRVAAAGCDILNLVLGPLDLDLLGLQIHLDRVVLRIVAVPGPGNLLGNLLCAVAGLLDGGLSGLLARLANLLNDILGRLRLGV